MVRGPELWKLLKERLRDPNRPAFRSGWQDVDLVWRVLRELVVKLDLGGMEPIIAQALNWWHMNPRVKNVSEYVEIVIPFYERWTHRHEFLTRGQREGETIREYFRAKQELLLEGDPYGNLRAAYPAFWSGLLDMLVWGHPWPWQIVGKNPPNQGVGCRHRPGLGSIAGSTIVARMESQQVLGKQIRAIPCDQGPGQLGEPGAGTPTPPPASPEGREAAGGPTAVRMATGMAAASWGPEGEGGSTSMLGGNERDPRGEGRSREWAGGYNATAEPSQPGAAEAGCLGKKGNFPQ